MAARLGGEFTALTTLADIDQAILSRLDLDRVIETVVMRMREVVPADYVSVAIVDRNAPAMVRIYTCDQSHGMLELERCVFSRGDTEVLLAYPDGLWLDCDQAVTPYLGPVVKLGAASLLVLPIVCQHDVVGTIVLGFANAVMLSDDERGRARNLGDRVGVAFATAAKDEQLYFQANYDPLTALPNRLFFMDQLGRRLAQAQREPRQFALLVVDLITSSSSTIRWATRPATMYCDRRPSGCASASAKRTRWRASAATSSRLSFPTSRRRGTRSRSRST